MGGNWRLAGFAFALCCAVDSSAQTPEELRAFLDRGQAQQAYDLGRRAPERLGEPAFDLMFGIAAVNSGHAADGVLALERYLLLNPGHEGARVELARGYYLQGEVLRAREEFELALARRPSPEVARVIEEYLAALTARDSQYKPTAMAYVELAGGYDSNPRAGVDNALLTLPVVGEVTIADNGLRKSDRTGQAAIGFRVTAPVAPRVALFAAGQGEAIRYPNESDFDQRLYSGSVGAAGQWNKHSWRVGAVEGYQRLGDVPYRRTHGAFADWATPIDERHTISAGVQGGRLEYEGANAVRDADFYTVSGVFRRAFTGAWRPLAEFGVTAGRERNVNAQRQDLSRDIYGARLGIAFSGIKSWTLAASGTYQESRYRDADAILLTTRRDRYGAVELALAYPVLPDFTLRLELSDAKNRSNIALYEYRRLTALLRGRYEFR